MIRMNTDVETKQVRQLRLSDFKGVDFTSSPLTADKRRGVWGSQDMVCEGNIKKRPGWKQVATFTGKINGMYEYQTNKFLVYAGTSFYKMELTTTGLGYTNTLIDTTDFQSILEDRPVQFFKQGTNIYIVGAGDFLVFNLTTIKQVFEHANTFVPTTTISIDYVGYAGATVRAAFERPNLMTHWRKNTCKGVAGQTPAEYTFLMDSTQISVTHGATAQTPVCYVVIEYLDDTTPTTLTLNGYYDSGNARADLRETYASGVTHGYLYPDGRLVLNTVIEPPTNSDNITCTFYADEEEYASANISEEVRSAQFGVLYGVGGITSQLFVTGGLDGFSSAHVNRDYYSYPLDFTYWPDNNYRDVGNSEIIGYSRISDGTLLVFKEKRYAEAAFFVRSGSYVANEETLENDTVYTEKAGYAANYSVARGAICNFLGDNVYLTNTGVKGIVLSENVTTDERYARERSRFVDKKLTAHTLSGAQSVVFENKMYLAVEGVCYVADARYKTQEKEDMKDTFNYEWFYWTNIGTLTNPVTCWFEDETDLYFGTNDGRICKFDDEFTDRTTTLISSGDLSIQTAHDHIAYNSSLTFTEGDRFVFSQPNIYHVLFEPRDLTYSDSKFRVKVNQCLFSAVTIATNRITLTAHGYGANDSYLDIYYHSTTGTPIGGLTLGEKYRVKVIDENTIEFTDGTTSTDITSQGTGTHEFLSATAMNLLWLEEEYSVRVVGIDDEDEKFDLYLYDIDLGDMSFKLKDGADVDKTMADMSDAGTIIIMRNISGVSLYVGTVDTVNHDMKLKLNPESEDMYFAYYDFTQSPYYDDAQTLAVAGMVTTAADINATWYTPVFDLGTNVYAKTLLSMTLSAEPVEEGQILFGYETRRSVGVDSSKGLTTFSFEDVDFDDFAFDTEFATSCTRRVKERNFNFIMFRFVSDNAYACEINDFTIRYNISKMNRGVR